MIKHNSVSKQSFGPLKGLRAFSRANELEYSAIFDTSRTIYLPITSLSCKQALLFKKSCW